MRFEFVAVLTLAALVSSCAVLNPQAGIAANWDQIRARWVQENEHRLIPEVADAIRRGEVIVGMTVEEASTAWAAWGLPYTVNRTRTETGVTEQYVFRRVRYPGHEHRYFYVRNGRVTAVQDSPGS